MSNTGESKAKCSICGLKKWTFFCDGCRSSFCITHAKTHRTELTKTLDEIDKRRAQLCLIFRKHEATNDNPLLAQIDAWEQDTINMIRQNAEDMRKNLMDVCKQSANSIDSLFEDIYKQMCVGRESDDFTEIELVKWEKQLSEIKMQLEIPQQTLLLSDCDKEPIQFIKIQIVNRDIKDNVCICSKTEEQYENNVLHSDIEDCSVQISESTVTNKHSEERIAIESLESAQLSMLSTDKLETNDDSSSVSAIETSRILDPTKPIDFLFVRLPSSMPTKIPEIFQQMAACHLQICDSVEEFLKKSTYNEQVIGFVAFSNTLCSEKINLLDRCTAINNLYSVYIQGTPPENDDERRNFFMLYSKIKGMFPSDQRLMAQWAMDTVNEYERIGDTYYDSNEKDKGRRCFESGIALYRRFSDYFMKLRAIH